MKKSPGVNVNVVKWRDSARRASLTKRSAGNPREWEEVQQKIITSFIHFSSWWFSNYDIKTPDKTTDSLAIKDNSFDKGVLFFGLGFISPFYDWIFHLSFQRIFLLFYDYIKFINDTKINNNHNNIIQRNVRVYI